MKELERANKLIKALEGTRDSFEDTCELLDFKAESLTQEERDYIFEEIFQCAYCGYWYNIYEHYWDREYGDVCEECLVVLEEEESIFEEEEECYE